MTSIDLDKKYTLVGRGGNNIFTFHFQWKTRKFVVVWNRHYILTVLIKGNTTWYLHYSMLKGILYKYCQSNFCVSALFSYLNERNRLKRDASAGKNGWIRKLAWRANQHKISRPISIKCCICLVVHAQNELRHRIKPSIWHQRIECVAHIC
jgi:hypothetical protein